MGIRGIVTGEGLQGREWGRAQESLTREAGLAGRETSLLFTVRICFAPSPCSPFCSEPRVLSTRQTHWVFRKPVALLRQTGGIPGRSEGEGKSPQVPSSLASEDKGPSQQRCLPWPGSGHRRHAPPASPAAAPAVSLASCPACQSGCSALCRIQHTFNLKNSGRQNPLLTLLDGRSWQTAALPLRRFWTQAAARWLVPTAGSPLLGIVTLCFD